MLPLIAIGGVIGAVMSVAKGASWLSDQLGSTQAAAASAGSKATPPPATASKSQFDAALSAQVAGHAVPVRPSTPTAAVLPPQQQHGPDYDTLARLRAGVAAYSHVGEHRGNHPKSPPGAGDDLMVARA